jgi:hypothetical protein
MRTAGNRETDLLENMERSIDSKRETDKKIVC